MSADKFAFAVFRCLFRLTETPPDPPSPEQALALEPMRLIFREDRATQAAAYFLRLHKDRLNKSAMSYIRLIKLLYFADRTALIELGHLITYDKPVSMNNGPVLSQVYNLIKGNVSADQGKYWNAHISRPWLWRVKLDNDPSTPDLSQIEERVLERVHKKFGKMRAWDVVEYSHKLPEWRHPHGSSIPIDIATILHSADVPDDQAEEILADMMAGSSL